MIVLIFFGFCNIFTGILLTVLTELCYFSATKGIWGILNNKTASRPLFYSGRSSRLARRGRETKREIFSPHLPPSFFFCPRYTFRALSHSPSWLFKRSITQIFRGKRGTVCSLISNGFIPIAFL